MELKKLLTAASVIAIATVGAATAASAATTYNFSDYNIGDKQGGSSIEDQFTLSVMQSMSGVDFTIFNDANTFGTPTATFIGIEDAEGLLTFGSISDSGGPNGTGGRRLTTCRTLPADRAKESLCERSRKSHQEQGGGCWVCARSGRGLSG